MTRRHLVIEVGTENAVLRGWQAGALAAEVGIVGIYSGTVRGWLIDASRLPDLMAYLQYRSIDVRIIDMNGGDAA